MMFPETPSVMQMPRHKDRTKKSIIKFLMIAKQVMVLLLNGRFEDSILAFLQPVVIFDQVSNAFLFFSSHMTMLKSTGGK